MGFSSVSFRPSATGVLPGVTRKPQPRPFGGFAPVTKAISVNLKDDTAEEIVYNASIISLHGAICRFRGVCPSLPKLHAWIYEHWERLITEEVGDALGDFLKVDVESSDIFHSTFVCILVDLDISNGLPAEILLNSSKGSWVQSLDYEGIPFRYRRCFKIGHLA
ncbi:hypothetical protein SUGI_1059620 [Cryptomeria japonica]|nr:hypothetical protein SUGI_1059620 [Cryptomeria japonica]